MKKFFFSFVLILMTSNAHAGFLFGVVCKDSKNAVYLFGENSNGVAEKTQCLSGECSKKLLMASGIFGGNGPGEGRVLDVEVTDSELSRLAGQDLRITLLRGEVLACGLRQHMSDIPGLSY